MNNEWLSVVATGECPEHQQLLSLRRVRLAMQEAIQRENWQALKRLDRLCSRVLSQMSPVSQPRPLMLEMLRLREMYRNLLFFVNQKTAKFI